MELTRCKKCGEKLPEQALQNDVEVMMCERCATVHYAGHEPVRWEESSTGQIETQDKRKRKVKRKHRKKFIRRSLSGGIELYYEPHTSGGRRWIMLLIVLINLPTWCFAYFVATTFDDPLWLRWLQISCVMLPFHAIVLHFTIMLVQRLDTITVQIRSKNLKIYHNVFFRFLNKNIDRRIIEQVYCKRRIVVYNRDSTAATYAYDVYYLKKGERKPKKLVTGLEAVREALFIEQAIEYVYKIEDVPVDGEYRSHIG